MAEEKPAAAAKPKAIKTEYLIFEKDDQGILSPLGSHTASTSKLALTGWLGADPNPSQLKPTYVIIPARFITELSPSIETHTTLRFE